jgi:hypothetical protein
MDNLIVAIAKNKSVQRQQFEPQEKRSWLLSYTENPTLQKGKQPDVTCMEMAGRGLGG